MKRPIQPARIPYSLFDVVRILAAVAILAQATAHFIL